MDVLPADELCEILRTNDAVLLSAVEGLLAAAHIPCIVADRNFSVLAGSIGAFPSRILVGNCCAPDARRLLTEAGYGGELASDDG